MTKENKINKDDKAATKRLDAIIGILLNQKEIQEYNQAKKIEYLTKHEFSNPEIANILNTSIKTIEGQKYRKKGKKENE